MIALAASCGGYVDAAQTAAAALLIAAVAFLLWVFVG